MIKHFFTEVHDHTDLLSHSVRKKENLSHPIVALQLLLEILLKFWSYNFLQIDKRFNIKEINYMPSLKFHDTSENVLI